MLQDFRLVRTQLKVQCGGSRLDGAFCSQQGFLASWEQDSYCLRCIRTYVRENQSKGKSRQKLMTAIVPQVHTFMKIFMGSLLIFDQVKHHKSSQIAHATQIHTASLQMAPHLVLLAAQGHQSSLEPSANPRAVHLPRGSLQTEPRIRL